jgi:hypothetical protein
MCLWLKTIKKENIASANILFLHLSITHLLTLVSIIHNFAPLSMTSIIVAYILSNINKDKMRLTTITFVVYIMTTIFTDIHHFIYAQKSGYLSRDMAQQTIAKTGRKMKNVYVKLRNNLDEEIWVKIYLDFNNELMLDNIVKSIDQMLINNRPIDVFFEYPNLLFEKVTPFYFSNNSNKSKVKAISTSDCESAYDIHCSSYKVLKDIIYGMIGKEDGIND